MQSFTTFTVFKREVQIDTRFVNEYNKNNKEPLDGKRIEQLINCTPYGSFIKTATDEQMQIIARQTIKDHMYLGYIALRLYDNTKVVYVDRYTVTAFSESLPFNADMIEKLLITSEYKHIARTLSDEQLSEAVSEVMLEHIKMQAALPELKEKIKKEFPDKWAIK